MMRRQRLVFGRLRHFAALDEVGGRLVRGVAATALGPLVSALVQLGGVPILLHSWGAARYGDWLVLSAVPSYLALSDLGFGNASGSDMTLRVAAGDRAGALRTFQSSWILVTVFSVFCLVVACAIAAWAPWATMLKLSTLSSHDASKILALLGCYVLVGQQTGVFESGYRADGNFATGTAMGAAIRFVEWFAATAAAVAGASLVVVAGGN
jgi:O-antigen/teichoic acid export membrane protein